MCARALVCARVCTRSREYVRVCVCARTRASVCVYVCARARACVCFSLSPSLSFCECARARASGLERERERGRQTDRALTGARERALVWTFFHFDQRWPINEVVLNNAGYTSNMLNAV